MSSLRKIESSRANGARSHGPVTDVGKKISSQNALRHGLLADIVVVGPETRSGFKDTLKEHLLRFRPADPIEHGVIEEMTAGCWRMRRAWCLETEFMENCWDGPDPANTLAPLVGALKDPDNTRALALLNR